MNASFRKLLSFPPLSLKRRTEIVTVVFALLASLPNTAGWATAQEKDPKIEKLRALLNTQQSQFPEPDKKALLEAINENLDKMWAAELPTEGTLTSTLDTLKFSAKPVPVDDISFGKDYVAYVANLYKGPIMAKLTGPAPKSELALAFAAGLLTEFRAPALAADYLKIAELPNATPAVRFMVYRAFQNDKLQAELVGPSAAKYQTALTALAKKETSPQALAELYAAVDLRTEASAADKSTMKLLLPLLRVRVENYYAGNNDGLGGEVRALEIVERIRSTREEVVTENKRELIELLGKLQYVCGVRYTQFKKPLVDALLARRVPVQEMRLGVWECVVATDRLLTQLVKGMPGSEGTQPEVEYRFAELMLMVKGPLVSEKANRDPVTNLYGPDSNVLYLPFLNALGARRAQVTKVLTAAKYANATIGEPAEWKVVFE